MRGDGGSLRSLRSARVLATRGVLAHTMWNRAKTQWSVAWTWGRPAPGSANIVQFPVGGEYGSKELQIAHLLIDFK